MKCNIDAMDQLRSAGGVSASVLPRMNVFSQCGACRLTRCLNCSETGDGPWGMMMCSLPGCHSAIRERSLGKASRSVLYGFGSLHARNGRLAAVARNITVGVRGAEAHATRLRFRVDQPLRDPSPSATPLTPRYVHGLADFTDEGCASFTFALRHVENKLLEATGALRIYTSLIGKPDLIYTHT